MFITEYIQSQKKLAEETRRNMQKAHEKGQGDADDFPHKTRSFFLAGIVAFAAMAGYALSLGILQVRKTLNLNFIQKHSYNPGLYFLDFNRKW